ncbi:MAG: hypothetical protein ACLFS5_08685 [Spirochaetaceae bacterium]
MSITRRHEQKYHEIYEKTLDQLEYRLRNEADFSVESLRRQLETFYVDEGNDWAGRGLPGEVVKSATIAATEAFLMRLDDSDSARDGAPDGTPDVNEGSANETDE